MLFPPYRPLADSEKIPVRSHRAAEAAKSPVEDRDADGIATQLPKKKHGKEKREEKKKKDKDRERKVSWDLESQLQSIGEDLLILFLNLFCTCLFPSRKAKMKRRRRNTKVRKKTEIS